MSNLYLLAVYDSLSGISILFLLVILLMVLVISIFGGKVVMTKFFSFNTGGLNKWHEKRMDRKFKETLRKKIERTKIENVRDLERIIEQENRKAN